MRLKLRTVATLVLAAAMVTPPDAGGQQPARLPRVGVLLLNPLSSRPQQLEAFRQGLRAHGYVEGQNIVIELRSAEGKSERLAELAAELAQAQADVIVAAGTEPIQAAQKATRSIPIVMMSIGDPVGAGIVASLARPGGNVTGVSNLATELSGKRLELLKETLPKLSSVAILWNPDNASVVLKFKETEAAARVLGIQLQSLEARHPSDIERGFQAAARARADAVVTADEQFLSSQRARIVALAIRQRLPVASEFREFAEAGALFSYGPSLTDQARRAATYVDKILKGAKPADLPVEQPIKFEFIINLKTAKQIGLTIPQWTLMKADRVIR